MIYNVVKENMYFDSVTLMLFSSKLNSIAGINQAAVMMGTDHNKALMKASGTLEEKYLDQIQANDLVIGINAENQEAIDEALRVLDEQFANKQSTGDKGATKRVRSLEGALQEVPNLNVSVISIPGRFAKVEAMKSLKKGLHVMLFSDNVSLEDEIELKDFAIEKDLLMMGPDCGTAIIGGVALGFANVIRSGNIGLIAASGTGLQEVSVIIDKLGGGISQALGTGGRDLSKAVGGRMMLHILDKLADDPMTEVIGLISKPPAAEVMAEIVKKAQVIEKPIVACFLGGDLNAFAGTNIKGVSTLEEAAVELVKASDVELKTGLDNPHEEAWLGKVPGSQGTDLRALYTGGTLAFESLLILSEKLGDVYSNIAIKPELSLQDPEVSQGHTVLDMGEDYFTDGRPHPMIDPSLRSERIVKDGLDPKTGVILFDCVLGYGSNDVPEESILQAMKKVKEQRSDVVFVGSVTGTENDPQSLARAERTLQDAGAFILPTNAQAAKFALQVLQKRGVIHG
ncbi:MAG: acyl-CoA synthetase FdrA [Firmicutes bacterium]|nr:acyl-CoA synthetase FdrA [Bacillota bacterium]